MLNRFLFWITARLKTRLIPLNGRPYLERYYVGTVRGITFYLHRFVGHDAERALHNHPSNSLSLVLQGSYIEERVFDFFPLNADGVILKYRKVRWFNRIRCNDFHRIVSIQPGTWTLFCVGPRVTVEDNFDSWLSRKLASARGVKPHPSREVVAGQLKGWGFLSFQTAFPHDVFAETPLAQATVAIFEPYVSQARIDWWNGENCPLGRESERLPL